MTLHNRVDHRLLVRSERFDTVELAAIHSVNQAAFGRSDEADLVDALRMAGVVLLSLVAEFEGQIVGHILFTRMFVDAAGGSVPAAALAPIAVQPEFQRRGVGTKLIQQGLDRLRQQAENIVIVVGHPDYYPRFGFSSEKARPIESPFPTDAFMALELSPGALDGVRGRTRYPAAFGL